MDGRLTFVHNGIIENYAKLKHKLTDERYVLSSSPDTDVFVKLLYRLKAICSRNEILFHTHYRRD